MQITETSLQFRSGLSPRKATQRIIIHHSASRGNEDAKIIHGWHLNNNGWAGIGYHFVITKSGEIQRGRPEHLTGAHAGASGNWNSIGICIVGNFDIETPAIVQMTALVWLIRHLRGKYGNLEVIGHKDVMATACPGRLFPWNELKQMLGGGGMAGKLNWKDQLMLDAKNAGLITSDHDPDEKADKWFVLAVAMNVLREAKK